MSSPQQAKAPKRELRASRPAPLKIWKDSHKIRKPPVIIYLQSPEVIQTEAGEFMTLVQRLTGRVNAHGDSSLPSSSSSIQSQTCHALPHSHTSVPVNPICFQFDDFSPPGGSGLDFLVKEDDFLVTEDNSSISDSNPDKFFSENIRSQHADMQSLLSPTTQSDLMSSFLPNLLLSPHIFEEFPLSTTQPDYFYSP